MYIYIYSFVQVYTSNPTEFSPHAMDIFKGEGYGFVLYLNTNVACRLVKITHLVFKIRTKIKSQLQLGGGDGKMCFYPLKIVFWLRRSFACVITGVHIYKSLGPPEASVWFSRWKYAWTVLQLSSSWFANSICLRKKNSRKLILCLSYKGCMKGLIHKALCTRNSLLMEYR